MIRLRTNIMISQIAFMSSSRKRKDGTQDGLSELDFSSLQEIHKSSKILPINQDEHPRTLRTSVFQLKKAQ